MDEDLLARHFVATDSWCNAVFDNAFDIIMIADVEGRFQYVNPSACRAFDYTEQELLTLTVADVLAPDEQSRLIELVGSLGVNEVQFGEWISRRQDNSFFPSEVSVMRMNDGRMLGIGRDITERRKNQANLSRTKERLAVALEVAYVGEWEMDLETLVRKLAGDHGSSGKRMEWKVGKGAIATRWRHDGVGVLAHIQASLPTQLLGRIEVRTC